MKVERGLYSNEDWESEKWNDTVDYLSRFVRLCGKLEDAKHVIWNYSETAGCEDPI